MYSKAKWMEDTLFDSHLTIKRLSLVLPYHMLAFFFLLFFLWQESEWKWRKTSLYCSVKTSASCVLWNLKCQLGYEFFLTVPAHPHTHTLWLLLLVSFYTQCWIIQRRLGLRFHLYFTEDHAVETVVNIRTKHLSGSSISCEHAADSANDQNNELKSCVSVVYDMTFCFYTVRLSQLFSFYLCSTS